MASREIEIDELLEMHALNKINGIMADVVKDNSEWCSDHLLVIMNEILHLAAELKKEKPDSVTPQKVFDSLLVNFKSFSKLLKASDVVSPNVCVNFLSRSWRELVSTCLRLSISQWCRASRKTSFWRLRTHRWSLFFQHLRLTSSQSLRIC